MKKKKIKVYILFLLLLLIGIYIYFQTVHSPTTPLSTDNNASSWNGEQNLNEPTTDTPQIAIPGITSLVFHADTTEQKVNFYNPEENDCLFLMRLYVNDKCYWESGYVESGKGYYTITLSEPIPLGTYTAHLQVQCFKEDGTALNSANVEFNLNVE